MDEQNQTPSSNQHTQPPQAYLAHPNLLLSRLKKLTRQWCKTDFDENHVVLNPKDSLVRQIDIICGK